jgi:glycosyltransferase involved in cell wall biosynthesis
VIVCAYNEAEWLPGCLDSLCRQTRPADEIIVVNNASTDATREVAALYPGVLIVDEPRKGLVLARRAGYLAASGEVLVYTDADCRAPEPWLVIAGAEITQNHLRSKHNSHIVGLGLTRFVSADLDAKQILEQIRDQGSITVACHPHHRTTRRFEIGTCYLWENRKKLAHLVDVWEAANRDDLFSVTSLKHYPYVANSDLHKAKHLYSWKTLVRSDKT